ncbi:MAG: [protein-PII] uridylyltransferase [Parvibaculales bacterium]
MPRKPVQKKSSEKIAATPKRRAPMRFPVLKKSVLAEALKKLNSGADLDARNEVLALVKASHSDHLEQVKSVLQQTPLRGRACANALSRSMDVIIQCLCDHAAEQTVPAGRRFEAEITVLAVGGYGRHKLAPGSDIDLLFLLRDETDEPTSRFIEYILYLLWDMGLKVGHSTRSINECVRQAKADMTIRTALLEARYIWGGRETATRLRNAYMRQVQKGSARAFVAAKLEERDQRHARTGESRYLVEPNIKEGKGGLRDLDTLFWIAKYCYEVDSIDELVDKGFLTKSELHLFKRCENFLWSARCQLHFLTGRAEERLSFDVQTAMAEAMGIQPTSGLNRVERFMRRYFLVAKDVGDLTRIFCSKLEEEQTKPNGLKRLPALFRRHQQVHGFTLSGRRLKMVRSDVFRRNPVNMLRMFKLAADYKLMIHPDTLREVTRSLDLIDESLRTNEEANKLFLDILTSQNHAERILRRMNEAGVLGRFLPDFGRIVALMQFNMYHHYTADEHLLRAIGILSDLERGKFSEDHPLAHELVKKNINRKVLYLAVLLHDIAKGRPEDHSIAGARIARRLGPRLGFSKAETELTEWLVREHLIMSDVAQRRDLSDLQTIRDFADKVQTLERLRHLLVLTVIDIRAVGPGVWNGWKGQLLRELYFEAEADLMGSASHTNRPYRVAAAKEAFIEAYRAHDKKISLKACRDYVTRHYDAYWLSIGLEEQLHHADLLRRTDSQPMVVDARRDTFQDITTLSFIGQDHPGLFSRLTGACAVVGLDIVDARIITTRDGMAVDVLKLQEPLAHQSPDDGRMARLSNTVARVMSGEILPADEIQEPRRARKIKAFDIEPSVMIDNEASRHSTVIEVSGLDRPGLLHALTRTLFGLGVTIVTARVATFGERAVDVFYAQDLTGAKITSPSKTAAIRKKLQLALLDPTSAALPEKKKTKAKGAEKVA